MALLLDSVDREELKKTLELQIVSGITTNPQLFFQAKEDPDSRINELLKEVELPVWIQVPEGRLNNMYHWCVERWEIASGRVIIKIPCTWNGMRLIQKLKEDSIKTCVTTVFTPSQALVAFHAGADFVAPYVNRSTRKGIDGIELIRDIAKIIQVEQNGKGILAASLKTPDEAVKAYQAGASHLTLPYSVICQLLESKLSREALVSFRELPGGSI